MPTAPSRSLSPRALAHADARIIFASAALALVNATAEEVLWRGAFVAAFPTRKLAGWLWPAVGFAVWHYAPQLVFANRYPWGASSLVLFSLGLALCWGAVAQRPQALGWIIASHVLLDFSGLGEAPTPAERGLLSSSSCPLFSNDTPGSGHCC